VTRDRDRGGKRKRFGYTRRDPNMMKDHANQKGGNYDNTFKSQYKVFRPKAGTEYRIRIMQPTWEGDDKQKHYGYEFWKHSGVGPDGQRYLCNRLMRQQECCCCIEVDELKRAASTKADPKKCPEGQASYDLKAKKNYAYWCVVRGEEQEGPQIFPVSWVVDRDMCAQCQDAETGASIYIDDPDEGHDLKFKCEAKGKYTEMLGWKFIPPQDAYLG
jgi:hypothetical protein